tara:strand:- start:3626 stop:4198 length:573 start_codon:yes stop_codon:yes gene_type:complete
MAETKTATVQKPSEVKPKMKKNPTDNPMKKIRVEKITLNIGAGAEPKEVEKAVSLLEKISKTKPVQTKAKKRIAAWNLRPGLSIGAKVTVRKNADELLKRLLKAIDMQIPERKFTQNGFSFGIREYIDIPEVKYDPKIGIIGLNVSVSLNRPGFRVKRRKLLPAKLSVSQSISKEEAITFAKEKLGVSVE